MEAFRSPAVPLITHDPFFSVWSFATNLTDDTTRHWTGTRQYLIGVVAIDGIFWEFLGKLHPVNDRYSTGYRKIKQVSCEVRPLSTEYVFETTEVSLKLTFTSPLLPDDLYMVSRPVSYVSYELASRDGKKHTVRLYWGFSSEFCVNQTNQKVLFHKDDDSAYFSSGDEHMLKNSGDDHRIEWGSFHVSAPGREYEAMSLRSFQYSVQMDYHSKIFPYNNADNHGPIRECSGPECIDENTVMTVSPYYPTIVIKEEVNLTVDGYKNFIVLSYNDIKCIRYFGKELDAWWKKVDGNFDTMLKKALADKDAVLGRVRRFEEVFKEKACKVSEKYYQIVALAFRQVMAGHKLTFDGDEILYFSKENYSNGCIGTVDVTYPSLPMYLVYNTDLAKGMMNPIFHMLDIGEWKYEFAPHDVGTYPLAEGQVYGFKERFLKRNPDPMIFQMPVEECGNMILCVAAICRKEGAYSYFDSHYDYLKQWADYLVKIGPDPDNQLCTDDFSGHLNHNCNLAIKAICAISAFGEMLNSTGRDGTTYCEIAKEFADEWETKACSGDHYRLAFDCEDSWSLKYNALWDRLLDLGLFSEKFYRTECEFYKTRFHEYGIQLDNRSDCTKTDWEMWTAAMFGDSKYTSMVIDSMYRFLCNTDDRLPFSDLVYTSRPVSRGFQARTVQGGLFACLLGCEMFQ